MERSFNSSPSCKVNFYKYCHICKHVNVRSNKQPCLECQFNDRNCGTDKPVNFEEVIKDDS